MFDAARVPAGHAPLAVPGPRAAIHPAAVACALLLHLGAFGVLLWAAASHEPPRVAEPPAIELTLETVAPPAATPEDAAHESEPPAPEPQPAEPPPPEPEPPPPEPPPPVRSEAVAPPPAPAPRPRPPQPPRERRAATAPSSSAPTAGPAVPVPATPAVASVPPVVTSARFRRPPTPPDYPMVARERGMTGAALIRALVGAGGETKEVRLHRSSGHEVLDSAALAAVRRWSFEPSTRDGQRIESWIEVPIRFQLR